MAIGFARLEYVKRSSGKIACAKAAYNSRSKVEFQGSYFPAKTFDWSRDEKPAYHEILLPGHVKDIQIFKEVQSLWNAVESSEKRKNAVVAMELVLALPDDAMISVDDRIALTRTFVKDHLIAKGFGAQIDIHSPQKSEEAENMDHNWHAHVIVTPRRFTVEGTSFESHKPRELITSIRNGKVISGPDWSKLWTQHQNEYFESRGMTLRVDPNGIVSQIHLGPYRMRGGAFSIFETQELKKDLNILESLDPKAILDHLTERKNIFSREEVDQFLAKHVLHERVTEIRNAFWERPELVQLIDKETQEPLNKFTTRQVLEEEKRILRIADRMVEKDAFLVSATPLEKSDSLHLTEEQTAAFYQIISGKRLSCIQGFAGTGKSHLLRALKDKYEANGYVVRALGPDSATARVLADCGFSRAENVHHFLFSCHHGKAQVKSGREVWVLDEAGKLGSGPLLELLKVASKNHVQLVLSGDIAQLPSVERGRMFGVFCERYGSQSLTHIQRQKAVGQRDIAKKLAFGQIKEAFDSISLSGGFRWSDTRVDAMQELVSQWVIDRQHFPCDSTIILAASNAQVRTLNHLVRAYRKEMGEIETTEYLCNTFIGQTYVSEGDVVEFRKNDRQLGVSNGLSGTLLRASESQFVVSVKEGTRIREVKFNPSEYSHFQLGYATTYYRSQGATVDRAYLCYSPLMNREMFYVGLTRHVRNVSCFVSHEDSSGLSDLKVKACRSIPRESTTDFSTHEDVELEIQQERKKQSIDELRRSDSFLSKLKGEALNVLDVVQSGTASIIEQTVDRLPNTDFYRSRQTTQVAGSVIRLDDDQHVRPLATGDLPRIPASNEVLSELQANQPREEKKHSRDVAWKQLEEPIRAQIREYYQEADNASCLGAIVKAQADSSGKSEKLTPEFRNWQISCGKRNEAAYRSLNNLSPEETSHLFSKGHLDTLRYRAARHKSLMNQEKPASDLEERLLDNMEELLTQLFPDGPRRHERNGIRFGSNGSLSVVCRGEKAGSFYDFSIGEGGGLLKLIGHVRGTSREEAKNWALDFVGGRVACSALSSRFAYKSLETNNQDSWVSLVPNAESPAPDLQSLGGRWSRDYRETARYAYKDQSGQILFYTLRLVEVQDPTKKIVLPLSYGHYGGHSQARWSIKGFQIDKKPLYGLDALYAHPNQPVLVVEGEKTADAARELFKREGMLVVTWSGGSSAVTRSDWSPLLFRDVIVWPDNDTAGFKASETLCGELRKLGVNSLKAIDETLFQREFPPKWDLADPLPSGKSEQLVKDLILNAKEKAVGIRDLLSFTPDTLSSLEKLQAMQVLVRVDQRLRKDLESQFGGKTWEVRNHILAETSAIIKSCGSISQRLEEKMGLGKELSESIALSVMIVRSNTGREPTDSQIDAIRQSLKQTKFQSGDRDLTEMSFGVYVGDCVANKRPCRADRAEIDQLTRDMCVTRSKLDELSYPSDSVHSLSTARSVELDLTR